MLSVLGVLPSDFVFHLQLLSWFVIQPTAAVLLLQVSAPDAGIFAAGAHSDYGMLTLLKTDEVPGLQVT